MGVGGRGREKMESDDWVLQKLSVGESGWSGISANR